MKKILGLLLIVIVLSSCIRRRKSDNLHYFQDCESIKGWFGVNSLSTDIKGHSGNYTLLTDQQHDYSMTFSSLFSSISSKPIRKIRASVWCYGTSKLVDGEFCLQIKDQSSNENKLWVGRKFQDFIMVPNTWTKSVIEVDVPKGSYAPQFAVNIFLWNKGTVPVYGDDFEIQFIE